MTDRITPERQKEFMARTLVGMVLYNKREFTDEECAVYNSILALLDQPAPPTNGEAVSQIAADALSDLACNHPEVAFTSDDLEVIRRNILSAPKTVTREDIDYIVMGFMKQAPENRGLYLKTFLLSKGIEVVEDKSEGEDE